MPTSLLRMRHNSCCGGMRATTRRYRQVAPTGVVGLTKPNRNPLCGYSSVTPKGVPPSLTREGKQRRPSFFYARGFEFFSWYGRKRVSLYEPSRVREGGPRQRWMSSHTKAFLSVSRTDDARRVLNKKDRSAQPKRSFMHYSTSLGVPSARASSPFRSSARSMMRCWAPRYLDRVRVATYRTA